MGSLSYFIRGNLSKFVNLIIGVIPQYIKNILGFREDNSSPICPFCPVIIGSEFRNSLINQEIKLSDSIDPDMDDKSPFLRAYPLYLS